MVQTIVMPFAPKIRKQTLQALNGQIIPFLERQPVTQILAGAPFDFAGVPHWEEQKGLLADKKQHELDVVVYWNKANLRARRMAQLSFLYGGVSQERVGITRQMAQRMKCADLPGIIGFELAAPAVFYVPRLQPHDGSPEKEKFLEKKYGPVKLLVLQFTDSEMIVRNVGTSEGPQHNLAIAASVFPQMEQAYVLLLRKRNFFEAQQQLIRLAKKLSDYLSHHPAPISNSSWPPLNAKFISSTMNAPPQSREIYRKTVDYIQFHLHKPMTASDLAAVSGVTYMHLNRVFKAITGLALMNFVTRCRLEAAKLMLIRSNERISDIAALTGFASLPSFSLVFARHEGMNPSQYRRKHRRK